MANILIVDDDPTICHVLARTVEKMGHSARACHFLGEAQALLDQHVFDVLLLDVNLPDGNGVEGLHHLSGHVSRPEIIVITGQGVPEDAEQAIRNGAWDYLQKASPRVMAQALEQVLRYRGERRAARPQATESLWREGIVGESPQLQLCLAAVAQMARGEGNVLLRGETGTGKEAFARALHANSPRRGGPFVVVDCASLPEQLVESLLFGHVRGAFTGADRDLAGLVRQADGGTLFLDEVGELPLPAQAAFLRVLQQHTFRPVGGSREEASNFRLVSATNRDLDAMVGQGAFRADLLFRLRGADIDLPPLRQRQGDVRVISEYYVDYFCRRRQMPPKGLSPEFLDVLETYPWPGNVRELINAVEYAVNAALHEPTLYHAHLPLELRARSLRRRMSREGLPEARPETWSEARSLPSSTCGAAAASGVAGAGDPSGLTTAPMPFEASLPTLAVYREQALQQVERNYIEQLMHRADNDIATACALADLSQSRLYALLKKHAWRSPGGRS